MNKTHKFLLCENPVGNDNIELYIYSTREGKRALIEIKFLETADVFESFDNNPAYTLYYTSKETGFPEFHELSVFDNWDVPDHKISVVLKEAGKWYKNYMIWDEKQSFEGIPNEALIKDYNKKLKGLKIIYSKAAEKWMVVFRGKIKVFNTELEADHWLIKDMNINEDDLNDGVVNEI